MGKESTTSCNMMLALEAPAPPLMTAPTLALMAHHQGPGPWHPPGPWRTCW
jgi:hypothetical protein